jgi:hypothetical protein
MESFRQKGRDEGYKGINWLRGIDISHATSPIDRNITKGALGNHGITKEEQLAFLTQ